MTIEAPKRIRENCIDLHTHGLGDARDFSSIDKAHQIGLKALAIGFRGGGIMPNYSDLSDYISDKGYDLKLVTMTECYFAYAPNLASDFIALGFDHEHEAVINWKVALIDHNIKAVIEQTQKLSSFGFSFRNLEEKNTKSLEKLFTGKVSERSWEIAKILVTSEVNQKKIKQLEREIGTVWKEKKEDYVKRYEDKVYIEAKLIFDFLFSDGKPFAISARPKDLDVKHFAKVFHQAKGKVFYSIEKEYQQSAWETIKNDVDGVMLWHGGKLKIPQGFSARNFIKCMQQEGKIIVGGSDFDPLKNHWQIGVGDGSMKISDRRMIDVLSFIPQLV